MHFLIAITCLSNEVILYPYCSMGAFLLSAGTKGRLFHFFCYLRTTIGFLIFLRILNSVVRDDK